MGRKQYPVAMIFHRHRAIFFHPGRTGGTAIEWWLDPRPRHTYLWKNKAALYGWDARERLFLQHAPVGTTLRLVGEELLRTYYTFSMVRNPFSRLVSVYYFSHRALRQSYPDFPDYVRALPALMRTHSDSTHHRPQVEYTQWRGERFCDHIGHFECWESALLPVKDRLGLQDMPKHRNPRSHGRKPDRATADFYTPETIRIMQDVYAEDFMCYGYGPGPEELRPATSPPPTGEKKGDEHLSSRFFSVNTGPVPDPARSRGHNLLFE